MRAFKNIEDIRDDVKACVRYHGFEAEDTRYATLGLRIRTEYISIDIWEEPVWDWEKSIVESKYTFTLAICRMGGKNSPDEFRAIASEMLNAADLVETLNNCRYKLVTEIPTKAK